ncbi:hypothetical protein [Metapseudomonas otitidis]|uniref:hypothetical protein n=1 Tax=Metapseudomonas otitidis TaxID=319939 RepID=UPI0013F6276D|nr:hypothetical protein [Pseudomonas otitidis]
MKLYHLVIFAGLVTLLFPKFGATLAVGTGLLAVVLFFVAALLGFPGWRSNKPRQ